MAGLIPAVNGGKIEPHAIDAGRQSDRAHFVRHNAQGRELAWREVEADILCRGTLGFVTPLQPVVVKNPTPQEEPNPHGKEPTKLLKFRVGIFVIPRDRRADQHRQRWRIDCNRSDVNRLRTAFSG